MKSAEYWWSSGMTEEHRNLSPIMWINAIQQDAREDGVREGLEKAVEKLEQLGSIPLANRIRNLLIGAPEEK